MPKPTSFSITTQGAARLLFTVQERTSGDLTVIIQPPEFDGDAKTDDSRLTGQRFSIHLSKSSRSKNVIKHTLTRKDGIVRNSRNYTAAIKEWSRFSAVFFRRTGSLEADRNILKKSGGRVVSLGTFDSEYFQLVYLILVGKRTRIFVPPPDTNVNILSTPFKNFNVIVLWQFMTMGSSYTSDDMIPKTFSDEELKNAGDEETAMRNMASGVDEDGALHMFREFKMKSVHSFGKRFVAAQEKSDDDTFMIIACLDEDIFVKDGVALTPEHLAICDKLIAKAEGIKKMFPQLGS